MHTKDEFKARVREWAQKLEVDTRVISLRTMKRKWASYTQTSGLLIFNAALLEMDESVKDYVIVHELLHIRIPNHGKLWKSFMRAYLGDYEQLERQLQQTKNLTGLGDL
ncbi:hypothetical protein U14_03438 [Candidatus Moduliflexus flocculans]|uniref:YgjP-like metallopeptidase domain-containing protein n=1 Tax=Candidatus Moduliflexus flocculans TaxID=1499966 RepID=A0A081BP71_9BACT|nr:hypothetical protein U14_03438 [Candidatus Moduliflexus flocculans]